MNCGVEQETGMFCGYCGVRFGEVAVQTRHSRSQPNSHVETVKGKLKAYGTYCLRYLKKPDDILESKEDHFGYGVSTILLFIAMLGISNYRMNVANSTILSAMGDAFIFIGMSMFLAIASVLIIIKLFGPELEMKTIVGVYGTYLIPFTTLTVLALLLILLNSFSITLILLSIAVLYAIVFLPLYLLSRLLAKQSSNLEPHYSFIAYLILFSSIFSLYLNVVLDASLSELLLWLNQF